MSKRRLVRAAAVFSGLALVLAACGDDDDDDAADTGSETTEAPSDETTTTAAAEEEGGGGALAGMVGTTPLPETTPEVEAFQQRMLEQDPALVDFNYGPESYDNVIIVALAARIAGTDGIGHANEIVNVTIGGEKCTSYADCIAIIDGGNTDIDYDGISGPLEFSGNGEPTVGSYGVLSFGDDNRIDDSLTEFRTASAPAEVAEIPLTPVEGTREGDGILKFGTLLPETGSLAFLGPPEIAGVNLAVDEINAAGGFNGAPVELTEGDSGDTTTDTATQTVTRLLSENVDAIIGAASSGVTLTVIDQVVGAGVTMFSPANTSKTLSTYDDNGLYFRSAPSDILQGQVLGEVIADAGLASIVILNLDDSYGNGLAEDLGASFTESGGEVLDTIVYDPAAQTFDAEVQQAAAADADGIVLIGFEESSRILATMVEQGIGPNDIPVFGVDGNMGNALGEDFDAGE
jgi:ABC-type branched-subunit amino acid transport system substrate-binding protein